MLLNHLSKYHFPVCSECKRILCSHSSENIHSMTCRVPFSGRIQRSFIESDSFISTFLSQGTADSAVSAQTLSLEHRDLGIISDSGRRGVSEGWAELTALVVLSTQELKKRSEAPVKQHL